MCISFEFDTLILQVVCPRSMMTQLSNFECLLNWIVSLMFLRDIFLKKFPFTFFTLHAGLKAAFHIAKNAHHLAISLGNQ